MPKQKPKITPQSDRLFNDPLEATLLVLTIAAMAGGVYFMWLLSQKV